MATTILAEILGVRQMLSGPLAQSPSFREILQELEAEYQYITNDTNNTGNAWQVDELTFTTAEGVQDYILEVTSEIGDFFKALNVVTVPEKTSSTPQYVLEFTEVEHIPQEW